jgi:hypothetical protein
MNIWLMQTGEQIPIRNGVRKMRKALLADKLFERGHSVFWWASAFDLYLCRSDGSKSCETESLIWL